MRSVLAAAWRVVVRRGLSDWAILVAAFITILLATILVASGPIYADAVTSSAVRRTLADAPVTESNVAITARVTPATVVSSDQRVFDEVVRAFSLTGGVRLRRGSSESFALAVKPGEGVTDLVVFRFFDQIEEHATIVDGTWPQPGETPHLTALSEEAAVLLDLRVGDRLDLTSRRDDANLVQVQVGGIYRVDDSRDPFWYGDELDLSGLVVGASFNSYGPLVVDRDTFFEISTRSFELQWRVFPDFENLAASGIAALRQEVTALEERLNRDRQLDNRMQVETGLGDILRDTERSLLATRSTTVILTLQLAVLAGYALLLTTGLLNESRQVETNLLRSRGASSTQLMAMAGMEGAMLTIPAAVAAPTLAALALRSFNHVGPLAGIDLAIEPVATPSSYALSAVAAGACLIALSVPAYRSARRFGSVRAARARQTSRGLMQRAGVDFALLAAAGLAFVQLRRYGAPITETIQGRLGIDPLLVAAPALGLLAGGVVALRLLPLLSRIAEAVIVRSTGVVPALGAWQVGRRPRRYSRAALLLILATGIGLFTVSYSTTWRISQSDRAEYDVGADLRVDPDMRAGSAIPFRVLRDAYDDLPGFEDAMPVLRSTGRIGRVSTLARYVIIDAARATQTIAFRSDLAEAPIGDLMAGLAAGRFIPAGAPLPGEPSKIAVDIALALEPLPDDFEPPLFSSQSRWEVRQDMRIFLLDAEDQIFRIDLGRIPVDGELVRLSADLGYELTSGESLNPAFPLSVAAIEVYSATPKRVVRNLTLTIGEVSTSPDGELWNPVDLSLGNWDLSITDPLLAIVPPNINVVSNPDVGLQYEVSSGSTASDGLAPAFFTWQPSRTPIPGPLPVLVSGEFADELGLELGNEIPLDSLPGYRGRGVVVGLVDDFPTVPPESGEPIVLDYQTYLAATFQPGFTPPAPDEFWLAVEDDLEGTVATTLRAAPFSSSAVTTSSERESSLQADPVALGTIGSLLLGFVAAAIFAGVGFAVNVAVSGRDRLVEFALLRAVGLSRRQLVGWLTLENAVLAVFGLVGGTALGLLLATVVLPVIALTQEARQAVPDVIVVYPWQTILQIDLIVIFVLGIAVGLLWVMVRRLGLGAFLRLGEE